MAAHALMDVPVNGCSPEDFASRLIAARRTTLPRRLVAPGPSQLQLHRILEAASAAPDHGQRTPWRFVLVRDDARPLLAQVFAEALLERDPAAGPEELARASEKAYRSPTLLLVVARGGLAGDEVTFAERLVSAGCAIQNALLMATAFGFGSALTSGKALQANGLRRLFSLGSGEQALCFLNIGTANGTRPPKPRPPVTSFLRELTR